MTSTCWDRPYWCRVSRKFKPVNTSAPTAAEAVAMAATAVHKSLLAQPRTLPAAVRGGRWTPDAFGASDDVGSLEVTTA
ncbi:hypothetical protein GCM10027262_60760 [Nocardia tengchongensis]